MRQPITRREASLRTVAIAALSGLAVVDLVALPYARLQGTPIVAVCVAAMAASLRVAWSLTTAGDAPGRAAWRAAVALGLVTCGGFVVTRAVAVPGVAEDAGRWTSSLGLVAVAFAVSLLTAGAVATAEAGERAVALRRRAGLRRVVGATAVGLALAPGAAVALVALGPPPVHHHGLAPNSISVHASHAAAVDPATAAARFRPGFGGHAGHYVYANAVRPHLPPWALALALGAAATFVWLAAASLAGRAAPPATPSPSAAPAPEVAVVGSTAPERARRRRRLRRRSLTLVTLALLSFAVIAADASAHATLVGASPAPLARLAGAPQRIVLRFSEPVQVVRAGDVALLDRGGRRVRAASGARAGRGAARAVTLVLRRALPADSYTVRYRVLSADAHALAGALVFSVGGAPLLPPAGRAAGGPSETGAWAVNARFAEIAALGLLLALVTFRGLVWGPALAAAPLRSAERAAAARAGRRVFWRAFWCVAAVAGLAEAGVLVVKAALVFGSGVWGSLTTPAAAERLAASSRFGDLLGLRGALLCAIAGVAFWAWSNEIADDAPERAPGGRRAAALATCTASAATLGLVSAQGHASQAPLPALSVAFDAVHLGAAAIWVGGLACLAVVLRAAPRALPGGAGSDLAAAALRRFSRVALVAVAVIAATGVARAVGELGGPAQLWATPYGRSLLLKSVLLAPVAVLALRNRRAIAGLARGGRPTGAVLRGVWRDVRAELVVAAGIVLVASVLVAQVPGRA